MSEQNYELLTRLCDTVLHICLGCAAVIASREQHDEWHRGLASHSHATLSVIGGPPPSGRVPEPWDLGDPK